MPMRVFSDYDHFIVVASASQLFPTYVMTEHYSISNLELELKKFRNQFEEATDAHEKEIKNLNNQITDLNRQREAALKEVAELKVQLKMTEETRDTIRRDLIEANRKIREGGTD